MADRILGPAGVLPPKEWIRGALVNLRISAVAKKGVSAVVCAEDLRVIVPDDSLTGKLSPPLRLSWLRLDLTEGCLSYGTRALLQLIAPQVVQPMNAPTWGVDEDNPGFWTLAVELDSGGMSFYSCGPSKGAALHVEGFHHTLGHRRTLAMALAAAKEISR